MAARGTQGARKAQKPVGIPPAATEAPRTQWLVIYDFPQPDIARALSPNGRAHFGTQIRAKKSVRERVYIEIGQHGLVPVVGKVILRPRFIYPDHRKRDDDNLATGVMKIVRDQLVKTGILLADDSEYVRQEPAEIVVERGARRFELCIEPVETTT